MSLIEQANKIIQQTGHTPDDITRLHQIKRQMSMEYHKAKEMAGQMECDFQYARVTTYAKAMKAGKTDSQSKEAGRHAAETSHGLWRLSKNLAEGMNAQIKAIQDFTIDYYTKQKAEAVASIHTQ